ncbi:MAG: FAD:protein FMN transferase [Thermodesulfovibrionia bacterium]|nr:FAD:protein FMN transferase [Thermodesulfovibrionia bacterium]
MSIRKTFIFVLFSVFLLVGCTKEEKVFKKTRTEMFTTVTITVVSDSDKKAEEAINAGFAEIKRIGELINYFSPDSELTAINRAAGKNPVKVSKDTLDTIKKAIHISDLTDGAFDPAIGPVIKLWGFSKDPSKRFVPAKDAVSNALRLIDYKKVKINEATSEVYLEDAGMELDLGGIAKGYGADKAIEVIKAKGIKAALVAIAGDIKGYGRRPDGQPWRVGVQNPRPKSDKKTSDSDDDILTALYLIDQAVSTSGDYERFFTQDGKRYHHIIDPKTGFPSESQAISVSVIAPQGYISDGISTGVFVLGSQKGIALLESMGLEGIIVDADMKIFITKGLKGKVEIPGM